LSTGHRSSERAVRVFLGSAAFLSGAAVLAVLAFLVVLSRPVLTGATDVWTWDWRPFHGHYGILPMIAGSLLVAAGAVLLAFPVGVLIAAFAHGLGPRPLARAVMGVVRLMTGIPTIVYAFVSAIVLVPFMRRLFEEGSGYCLLSTVLVLSALVLPTVVLLVHARWQSMGSGLRVTCAALGLSRSQAILHVLLPVSRRGLLVAGVFAFARAVGDTMIALLLSGNAAQVPSGPLEGLRTLTAHIALVHSTDTQDAAYASIFAAGLILLLTTATLSLVARALARDGAEGGLRAPPR
jgi:phosphate transport system permease protein